MTEWECPACKTRRKVDVSQTDDLAPACLNVKCERFGKPMRELV